MEIRKATRARNGELLDEKDEVILRMLRANARISLAQISKNVGILSPAIRERMRRMESLGIIKGYSAVLDYKKLDLGLTAFVGLSMGESECCNEGVFDELEKISEVLEAHFPNGSEDILVKIVTEDTESLVDLLGRMNSIDGIIRTRTLIALTSPIEREARLL